MPEMAEERLEAEMRRVLIDFFERFFPWCALFRPVKGSRGMRAETLLTRFAHCLPLIPWCDFSRNRVIAMWNVCYREKSHPIVHPSPDFASVRNRYLV